MTAIPRRDLLKFELELQSQGPKEMEQTFSRLSRKIALQILRGTVLRTPVDTGRARANWQVTIGAPASGEVDALDKDGGATMESGVGALSGMPPFASIWITNNLPYINRLEFDSWSSQAPDGMLRVTVAEVEAQFGVALDDVKE